MIAAKGNTKYNMNVYPSDLSDSQWDEVSKYLDIERTREVDIRSVFNGILYLVKTGCQWRFLPKEYPKYNTVYYYFNTWKHKGVFERMQLNIARLCRRKKGKLEEPTVGIVDSQSVKATLVSTGGHTGFDAGKKIKGIKRHIVVDTLGLLLCVVVHSAAIQDRDGAIIVLTKLKRHWLKIIKIFADGGYQGEILSNKVKDCFQYILEIIKRNELGVFKILPKRWIVERTFSWIDTNRRTAKSYERHTDTVEAVTQIAAIRIMLKQF